VKRLMSIATNKKSIKYLIIREVKVYK